MTAQIVQAPAPSRRMMSAGAAVGLYLWLHLRRSGSWVAAAWIVMAALDYLLFAGKFHRLMAVHSARDFSMGTTVLFQFSMLIIPILTILTPMALTVSLDDALFLLPIRTRTLVSWLCFYGAAGSVICWLLNVALIWRPSGLTLPWIWPAVMVLCIQCAMLTARFLCAKWLRPFAIIFALLGLVFFGVLSAVCNVPETALILVYLALAGAGYGLAAIGATRTRHGDRLLGEIAPRLHARATDKKQFSSKLAAQIWIERRMERWFLPAIIVYLNTSILLMRVGTTASTPYVDKISLAEFLTNHAHHIYAITYGNSTWAGLSPLTPIITVAMFAPFAAIISIDLRERNNGIFSFLKTHPIGNQDWITAKLRVCADSAAAIWLTLIPFIILWTTLPARMNGRMGTVGGAILANQDSHSVVLIIAMTLGLMLLTWKAQADNVFLIFTARSPYLRYGVAAAFWGLIVLTVGAATFADQHAHAYSHSQIEAFLGSLMAIAVLIKLAVCGRTLSTLLRRRLLTMAALRRILIFWVAAAVTLIALFSFALTPYHITWWQMALGVLLLMPGVRFALAPLALAWERSR
jgi:hypothetical protein